MPKPALAFMYFGVRYRVMIETIEREVLKWTAPPCVKCIPDGVRKFPCCSLYRCTHGGDELIFRAFPRKGQSVEDLIANKPWTRIAEKGTRNE